MSSRFRIRPGGRSPRSVASSIAALTLVFTVTACTSSGSPASSSSPKPSATTASPTAPASPDRPNIVFVLTDDLAMNLVPYLPHVRALARAGTSFSNYTVTDSLCCPSRSSIFTGRFPHDTGVFSNTGAEGGFATFHQRGEESSTFATDLQHAGYRTAMMGKYLNGYLPRNTEGGSQTYVPPGWNEWDVAGNGYPEFNYDVNEDHRVQHYGTKPKAYLTTVLSEKASQFITASAAAKKPFLVEVATFAPHAPYTPAPRDATKFPSLKAPRGPAFDTLPKNAPSWLATRTPLTRAQTSLIDTSFRKRVQAVQSVDRMIGALQATLRRTGQTRNTVIVFSSDNGYHMGEYRLMPGKMTAFDTDVNVPLIAAGPGVAIGQTVSLPAENVDLRSTFDAWAGASTPADVDGHSLTSLLSGGSDAGWRTASLVEHHGPDHQATDPDLPSQDSGNPPTYAALRTTTYTYVEYADGAKEYYDRTQDPHELDNIIGSLPPLRVAALHAALEELTTCHGQSACWSAAHAAP